MRSALRTLAATGAVLCGALTPAAAQVTLGTANGANCFPFTCGLDINTFYQQVYVGSAFPSAGFITGIDFFLDPNYPGNLNTMSFDVFLSTTTLGLNVDGSGGISSTNPDGNRGADNTLFGSYSLSGTAPSTLSLTGSPFYYDPALGNLLFDLRVNTLATSSGAYYQAQNGGATDFSRATDFGTDFAGWGLVTRFDYGEANVVPEPATMSLLATGLVGMAGVGLRRRRRRPA